MLHFETNQFRRVYRVRPMIEGAAISSALLLAEHIILWRWRGSLPLPVKYAAGVGAILLGLYHACSERDDLNAAIDATLITAASGAVVGLAHLLRKVRYERSKANARTRQYQQS